MKYLVYCGPGIGDFVLILPLLNSIKMYDSLAEIDVFTTSSYDRFKIFKEMLKIQNCIDNAFYYSKAEIKHSVGVLFDLGFKKYDFGFVLQYTNNKNTSVWPSVIARYASKNTVGVRNVFKDSIKYDFYINKSKGLHILEYEKALLEKIDIPFYYSGDCLLNTIILDSIGQDLMEKFYLKDNNIILCIGTAPVSMKVGTVIKKNDAKSWSYESWISLANKLIDKGYNVILLGGAKEALELESYDSALLSEKVINLVGKTSILQSIALIKIAKMVIGADTGIMHCAGALNVSSLTLFGCTDFKEYLPIGKNTYYLTASVECSPCFGSERAVNCIDKKCMKNISVVEVYNKVLQVLENKC